MAEQDDVLHLIDDTGVVAREDSTTRKWKIAVIDDDAAVHEGTRFALSDYSLNGQGLEILSAYSAAEGRKLMRAHPDIAAVLLDVIMETDVAGLELVEFIRSEIKNETVRIILRTGQPGQAPERRVIVQYDINDYKAKTELTADKLFTSLTAALRSYQQLERMVQTRRGLEIIIDGYPGSYGQILTNLFLNAVNHAFLDGRAGTISISAKPRGHDDVELIFSDNGAGMSPDVQRQAFDPFFTTRRNEGGTGLGLHIVYNLVTQQLGGRMMLESRLGQGTTFRIIMPRIAKGDDSTTGTLADGTPQWPNRTMSST